MHTSLLPTPVTDLAQAKPPLQQGPGSDGVSSPSPPWPFLAAALCLPMCDRGTSEVEEVMNLLLGLGITCTLQLLGFAINEAQLPNLQLPASYPVIQPSLVIGIVLCI